MTDVLFRLDVDESGAVRGFRISRDELTKLEKATKGTGRAARRSSRDVKRFGDETKRTGQRAATTSRQFSRLKGLVAGVFTIGTVRQAIQYADTYKNLEARLRIVTDTQDEFNTAQEELFAISQRTSTALEATTDLYARLELSLKGMNVAQEDVLQVTETINQAMIVSGATTQEATAAIIQLSQGLAAGALRGDEFRSVMEQAPRLVTALSEALGVTRGELRELANEGRLSTEIIVNAVLQQSQTIQEEAAKIPVTVGRAFQQLGNAVLVYIGQADDATEATTNLAAGIVNLAQNIDLLAEAIGGLLTQNVGSIAAAMQEWRERQVEAAEGLDDVTDSTEEAGGAAVDYKAKIQELLGQMGQNTDGAKEYASAINEARAAILAHGTVEQQVAINNIQFTETLDRLSEALGGTAEGQDLLVTAAEAMRAGLEETNQELRDSIDPVVQLSRALNDLRLEAVDPMDAAFLNFELLLEEVGNQLGEESLLFQQLAEQIRLARLELDAFNDENEVFETTDPTAGGFFRQLKENLKIAGEEAGLTMGDAFLTTIQDNPRGALAAANSVAGSFALFKDLQAQGLSDLDALNETIIAAEIPVVSEIAQLVGFINDIFGGKLLGTSFETVGGARNIGIDELGVFGELLTQQEKEKSFFRGTSRRTLVEELDAQTQAAAEDLFDAAFESLFRAVEALGVEAPDFIAGKFIEEFDAEGNVTRSVSEFFGRTFEETFDEFGKRLIAEQIIAAVGQATPQVEVEQAARISLPGLGLGGEFDARRLLDESGLTEVTTVLVSEAHFIAERWREDAELLLEGAQLLLVAQSAIEEGAGLFESLTLTVDVTEELAHAGETLTETYTRLVVSTELLEDSLELLDVSLDLTREGFVRFAEEFTDAAGGVERAAQLWKSYFETFFEADELLEARLAQARRIGAAELGDIGLDLSVGRNEFRELFENVLPTLSADALAEWLEAAEALGIVIDLEEKLLDARLEGLTLDQSIEAQIDLVARLREEFDGSTASHRALVTEVGNLADLMDELSDAFSDTRDAVNETIESLITDLRRETLSDEELFAELRQQALTQAELIAQAGSREEVLSLVQGITDITRDARGLIEGTALNDQFIAFLENVQEAAQGRLGELEEEAITKAQAEIDQFEAMVAFTDSTAIFGEAVQVFAREFGADGQGLEVDDEALQQSVRQGMIEGFEPFDSEGLQDALSAFADGVAAFNGGVENLAAVARTINTTPPSVNINLTVDSATGEVEVQQGGGEIGLT